MAVIQRRATEDLCKCPLLRSTLLRSDSSIHYEGTPVGCRSYCDSLRRAAVSHCLSPGSARAFDPIKPIIRTEPLRSCGKQRAISAESSVHNTQMRLNIAAVKVGGWVPTAAAAAPTNIPHGLSLCWQTGNVSHIDRRRSHSSHLAGTPEVKRRN